MTLSRSWLLPLLTVLSGACATALHHGASNGATGEPYRMNMVVGTTRTPAKLVVEVDARRKAVGPATLHTFSLQLEETVKSIDRDSVTVAASLVDVVGESGDPQLSDKLALALDDLRVTFRRSDRANVTDVRIDGVHAPLDPHVARAIVLVLIGGLRGPALPLKSIGVQDDYQAETSFDLVGVTAHLRNFYTLLAKNGDTMRIRDKGKLEAIGSIGDTRRQLAGDTFSEETFDLGKGVLVSGEYEWTYTVDDDPAGDVPGGGKLHVRAERGTAAKPTR
jgi:hypothetical protein